MIVLALNCGSSSVKFRLFDVEPSAAGGGLLGTPREALLDREELAALAHRTAPEGGRFI